MTENSISLKNTSPHSDVQVELRGNTTNPKRALILLHGRGASAENILRLTRNLDIAETLVCAPQANDGAWYPRPFMMPRTENEPHLDSALNLVDELISYCSTTYGLGRESIVLAGFSQGACLAAEYVTSHPAQYAGICLFSGGVIGDADEIAARDWHGDLAKTPVYLGCDEHDPYIPAERVRSTAAVYEKLGANVTSNLYAGLGHAIHPEGIAFLSRLLLI